MTIKTILLASTAMLALSASAFAADTTTYQSDTKIQQDSNGNYKEKDKVTKTDAAGTDTSFEKKASVDVKANGDVDKSTTTKKVIDPTGLNNKSTVTTSNTEKTKNGMVETKQAVAVDGKVVSSESKTAPQQ